MFYYTIYKKYCNIILISKMVGGTQIDYAIRYILL